MNKYLSDIVSYFEYLSMKHPELQHAETEGDRVFEVVAYEDAFSDFKTAGQEKRFFVRVILPTVRFENQGDNARKMYQMGMVVGRYYSRREGSRSEMVQAWSDAERVADDFLARMVADSRNGYALFNNSMDKIQNLNITGDFWDTQGDGSYCAVMYMFEMGLFRCLSSDDATDYAEWTDGGLTI